MATQTEPSLALRLGTWAASPLIHHRPLTGGQGKFSLEYGVAAAVLDDFPELWSFTDEAVGRVAAQELLERVQFVATGEGEGLLDGECEIVVRLGDGRTLNACLDGLDLDIGEIDWRSAASILAAHAPTEDQ